MVGQVFSVKHAKQLPAEAKTNAPTLETDMFERDPAKASPTSAAGPPAKTHLLRCSPLARVLGAHFLNGVRAYVLKVGAGAGRQVAQFKPTQEPRAGSAVAIRGSDGRRVTPVEHLVHFNGRRI